MRSTIDATSAVQLLETTSFEIDPSRRWAAKATEIFGPHGSRISFWTMYGLGPSGCYEGPHSPEAITEFVRGQMK